MNKEMKILNEVYYWKELLRVPYFVIDINNKTKYAGYVNMFNDKVPCLTLNLKYLKKQPPITAIALIFHEFGHIIYRTCFNNFKGGLLKSEILAEKYALKNIKKQCTSEDYKKHVRSMRKSLKNPEWRKRFPIHDKAFRKIYK